MSNALGKKRMMAHLVFRRIW